MASVNPQRYPAPVLNPRDEALFANKGFFDWLRRNMITLLGSSGGGTVEARKADFDNYYAPTAAYLFAQGEHLTDRSGNGITLTESSASVRFGPSYVRGLNAVRLSAALLELRSTNIALNLTGAWSGEFVFNPLTWTNNQFLASWRDLAGSETEANNITWSLGLAAGSAVSDPFAGEYWEFGAGTGVAITAHGYIPPGGTNGGSAGWMHLVQTRSAAGRFRSYVNGRLIHEQTGLTMPTGGTTAQLRIGGQFVLAQYCSIYSQELDGDQVVDLAQKRMGLLEAA